MRKFALNASNAWIVIISVVFFAFNEDSFSTEHLNVGTDISMLYHDMDFNKNEPPPYDLFELALVGYRHLDKASKLSTKGILTVIDFRRSANDKRLWVLDLRNRRLLYHSLAAHGRNSGDVFARTFSNTPNSNQSSLGFFVTGKTYVGKHGISLKLHGVESGINDKAEARAIVMHGASYVSESHIKKFGRLGRSFGCPAVPMELHKKIIPQLADGTCLFIYYPDPHYIANSTLCMSDPS